MTREFLLRGDLVKFRTESTEHGTVVSLGDRAHEVDVEALAPGRMMLRNSRGKFAARVVRDRERIWVWIAGRVFEFQIPPSEQSGEGHGGETEGNVRAPMPGTLIKLAVAVGDVVEAGQVVAVVEAMKMEHSLRAPRAGRVEAVAGTPGSVVDADTVLVTIGETA